MALKQMGRSGVGLTAFETVFAYQSDRDAEARYIIKNVGKHRTVYLMFKGAKYRLGTFGTTPHAKDYMEMFDEKYGDDEELLLKAVK